MLQWLLRCFPTTLHKYWKVVLVLVFINFVLLSYNVILFDEYKSFTKTDEISTAVKKPSPGPSSHGNFKIFNDTGFALAVNVRERCRSLRRPYKHEFALSFWIQRMHLISGNSNLYCPVEKVGTTFWRRVIFQANNLRMIRHPYQVPIYMALGQTFLYPDENATASMFENYFKFLFVRNPFHRILSAYIDKIFVPNPQFWDLFGKQSIHMFRKNDSKECYHDATFAEFVQFVVWSRRHMQHMDPHFLPAAEMCVPCSMEYSFVGKMETFTTDIYPVLDKLHLDSSISILKTDLKGLSDLDAIEDSIFSPFGWQKDILKCMDWNEALHRVWRKLQMRGLIGMDIKLPISKITADKVSREEFSEMAKRARKSSDPAKLKQQKKDVFIEMYRSVPVNVLVDFVKTYTIDFYLFNYDTFPEEIFNRTLHFAARNFVDFWN